MKISLLTASAAVFLSTAVYAEFDVTAYRTVISSETISNAVSASDVDGSSYNATPTGVRMYYDARDEDSNYALQENFWNHDWSLYIDEESALGPKGPLGYVGPLSSVGPLADASYSWAWGAWSPTTFSAGLGYYTWDGDEYFGYGSPYGAQGPLGESGPLTETAIYTDMYHLNETGGIDSTEEYDDDNDFNHQLDPSGVWGVLGPAGPLGALGPVGPLGPLGYGASGAVTTNATTGAYEDQGQEVRHLEVPFDTAGNVTRRYDLVELYPRAVLVQRQATPSEFVNDTSFTVDAVSASCSTDYAESNHTLYFKSPYDQWVSVVLTHVNAYAELDFTVTIKDDSNGSFPYASDADTWFGAEAADFDVSTTAGLVNIWGVNYASDLNDFAMFRVKAGEVIKVVVQPRYGDGDWYDQCGYLLHVVGSGFLEKNSGGQYAQSTLFDPIRQGVNGHITFNTTGNHQQAIVW